MDLTIAGYGHTLCRADWGFATEGESFHRMYYVLGGTCRCRLGGEVTTLQKGTLYLLPRHTPYAMEHDAADPFYVLWQHVRVSDRDMGREMAAIPIEAESAAGHVLQAMASLSSGTLVEDVREEDPLALYLLPLCRALLMLLERDRAIFYPLDQRLSEVLRLVSEHPDRRYTVAQLAACAKLERSHFSRLFHRQFRISAQSFLIRARLEQGALALLRGESVGESAAIAGYQDTKAFIRAFSGQYGLSPAKYRKNHILQP